jgi:hypothetical protein
MSKSCPAKYSSYYFTAIFNEKCQEEFVSCESPPERHQRARHFCVK